MHNLTAEGKLHLYLVNPDFSLFQCSSSGLKN